MKKQQISYQFSPIPNECLEKLPLIRPKLSGAEYEVIHFIWRKTFGYNKETQYIPVKQIMDGTRLSQKTVKRSLKKLKDHNIISIEKDDNYWRHLPSKITINPTKDWDFKDFVIKVDEDVYQDGTGVKSVPSYLERAGDKIDPRTGVKSVPTGVKIDPSYILLQKDIQKEQKDPPAAVSSVCVSREEEEPISRFASFHSTIKDKLQKGIIMTANFPKKDLQQMDEDIFLQNKYKVVIENNRSLQNKIDRGEHLTENDYKIMMRFGRNMNYIIPADGSPIQIRTYEPETEDIDIELLTSGIAI